MTGVQTCALPISGKLREFQALCAPLGIDIVPQSAFHVSEAEEPHFTFVENALAKARHGSKATGLPAFSDDSGICVDALSGAPGVHSARYAQSATGQLPRGEQDARNNAKLIAALDLVVTVDTAVAHLAGAMGKPTFLMLAKTPDYRWFLSGDGSPWYPSMRLFRQGTAGVWRDVVEAVSVALRQQLAERKA